MKTSLKITMATLSIVLLAACSRTDGEPGGKSNDTVSVEAVRVVPMQSYTDWVSYADQVVLTSIKSEHEIPPSAQQVAIGEGQVGRILDVAVNEVIWSRSGASIAEGEVQLLAEGWIFHGERRQKLVVDGRRLEVGNTYIMAIYRDDDDPSGFSWHQLDALQVEDAKIKTKKAIVEAPGSAAKNDIPGGAEISSREFTERLRMSAPDPIAAKYAHLNPLKRAEQVRAEYAQKSPVTQFSK